MGHLRIKVRVCCHSQKPERESVPICDLGAKVECEHLSDIQPAATKVTNRDAFSFGLRLSLVTELNQNK